MRAYFLYDRRRLGLLSRVAYRTLHAYAGAALEESDAVPGGIRLAQSFGSLAHGHPHLHLIVPDREFRRAGSWVAIPVHDTAVLAEAWRRAVLARFARPGGLEADAAASRLSGPHSGFSAHVGPRIEPTSAPNGNVRASAFFAASASIRTTPSAKLTALHLRLRTSPARQPVPSLYWR